MLLSIESNMFKINNKVTKMSLCCCPYLLALNTFNLLTLRLRNTYIHVFRVFFGFSNFYATSFWFQKLGVSSFHSAVNLDSKAPDFWCLHVLVCAAQQTSTTNLPPFFQRFQTEEHVLRVNTVLLFLTSKI